MMARQPYLVRQTARLLTLVTLSVLLFAVGAANAKASTIGKEDVFTIGKTEAPLEPTAWQQWQTVGRAQLTWGFWVIYDSELRTPDGHYPPQHQDIALIINYRRDIEKQDLVDATDDQWKHLGVNKIRRQQWLSVLAGIWPDIKKGDELVFVINHEAAFFYQGNRVLGRLTSKEMADAFLAIWLDPQTSYPKMRRLLIGTATHNLAQIQ